MKLVVTADYEESLARLVRGEADAAALGYHVGLHISDRLYPDQIIASRHTFMELPLAVAVSKRHASRIACAFERWNCLDTCRWYVAADQRLLAREIVFIRM